MEAGLCHAEVILDRAERRDGLDATIELLHGQRRVLAADDARIRRHRVVVTGEQLGRIGVAADEVQAEGLREIEAEFRRVGPVVVEVADALLAGLQKLGRGHGCIGRAYVSDVERVVEDAARAADAGTLIEGAERTAFKIGRGACRPLPLLRDDGNHAAQRIGAVKPALGTAQHLDALDIADHEMAEIERPGGRARIADVDAVDEYLDVV